MDTTLAPVQTQVTKSTSRGKVVFSRLFINNFQPAGTQSVEVKQTITNTASYPSMRTETELSQGLVDIADFPAATPKVYTTPETRVTWIKVPTHKKDGSAYTEEDAKAALAKYPDSCIYKILSSEPILTEAQKHSINMGQKSKDDFANTQAVRYPENHPNPALAGKLILFNGKVQYRVVNFWQTYRADIDTRATSEVYHSPEIDAELNGASVLEGQGI